MTASDKDRQLIRDLATRVAAVAAEPIQQTRLAEWKRHNSLKPGKPMVLQAPEGVWDEFVPGDSLQCEDEDCRRIEWEMRRRLQGAGQETRNNGPVCECDTRAGPRILSL